ncbi:glycosyl transferase [Patiriisocius marinistellae]|uniref:Glycosyl transferase n=1 Tax=Patiriisocius marinistellae TaxID=2494560 RepID=A0A5J4FUX2_9FLAO|nr:glycosyltransferase family 2 protein [Patiriisocius marinistellae]GEQ84844.1 glycosyl transferase [Patiriisocius marinistellae]
MLSKEKKKHTNTIAQPLISIITPLYNAAPFIAQTIASIQSQTYSNWELLIVDDNSTDASVTIVKTLAKNDARIKLTEEKINKGAAQARNKGTSLAQGTYIAFLDADDLWHSQKLEIQLYFMSKNNCNVSFTSYVHIDENGYEIGKRIKAINQLTYKKQHNNNYLGNLTGMYNCAVLGKIEAPTIRKRQDWAVWLEAIKRSAKPALGIQQDLAYYRVHNGNMSRDKLNLVKYNYAFYREYLGYSTIKSSLYLLRFFWEYFVNRPKHIEQY